MAQSLKMAQSITSQKERVHWVDLAKGLGISLVVVGHTLRGLDNSSILPNSSISFIDSWIYSFHMPLFFVIAGFFLSHSIKRSRGQFVLSKIATIAYPYIVWSLLFGLMQSILSQHTNSSVIASELWRIFIDPIGHFWFLYVLFICEMISFIFQKLHISAVFFIIFAVIYYFLGPFIPVGVMYQVRTYLLFMAIGLLFGMGSCRKRFEELTMVMLILLVLFGFSIVTISVNVGLQSLRWVWPLIAISGSSAIFGLALIFGRLKIAGHIETLGSMSLEIYVAHVFASAGIRIILQKGLHIIDPTVHIVLGIIFGLYGPILLVVICRRLGFRWLFRIPLTKKEFLYKS